ncbi:hypothetical protein [Nonomuraea basaltis]|uniref:hypothetical protein n=1 Tax=Nonomuraea basaltis TaxID=2495887 RepID=UPI00110C6FE0|nr:hypothetical protein [Nonomuraea basaltis]TMR90205.1 hypothetical protein EJK15_56460 [Nonomuraea basaltis]
MTRGFDPWPALSDATGGGDDEVPPDAPLTTKEGWRLFVDYQPTPPVLLSADQLLALSRRERAAYDEAGGDLHWSRFVR